MVDYFDKKAPYDYMAMDFATTLARLNYKVFVQLVCTVLISGLFQSPSSYEIGNKLLYIEINLSKFINV